MIVPVQVTWTTGQIVTAAQLNANVRDAINFLLSPPLAVMRQTVAQSLANSTQVAILLDVEDLDRDNGHSTVTNTSRYTCQTPGWYWVSGGIGYSANATGMRVFSLLLNGVEVNGGQQKNTSVTAINATVQGTRSKHIFMNINDYVEVGAYHTAGAALNTAVTSGEQSSLDVRWAST